MPLINLLGDFIKCYIQAVAPPVRASSDVVIRIKVRAISPCFEVKSNSREVKVFTESILSIKAS